MVDLSLSVSGSALHRGQEAAFPAPTLEGRGRDRNLINEAKITITIQWPRGHQGRWCLSSSSRTPERELHY